MFGLEMFLDIIKFKKKSTEYFLVYFLRKL